MALLASVSLALQLPTPAALAPSVAIMQQPAARALRQTPSGVLPQSAASLFPQTTSALAYVGQTPTDPASRAAALRAATAKEEEMKAERAAKALQRAANAKAGNERQAAAAAASGIPPCPDGPWGTSTSLLTAKSCYRVRDGIIDTGKKTGAFLIF